MMNVPFSVIIGKSPMKTVCSLISPVWAFMKRAVTKRGREKVMSFSLHSSSEYFGGSNSGSASSSFKEPVKSSMGEMSVRVSAIPSSRNHLNESRCTATRSGSGMTSRSFANEKRCRAARRAKASLLNKCAKAPQPRGRGKGTQRRQTASIAVATLARQLRFNYSRKVWHGSCELMIFAGYDLRCRRSRVVGRPSRGGPPPHPGAT